MHCLSIVIKQFHYLIAGANYDVFGLVQKLSEVIKLTNYRTTNHDAKILHILDTLLDANKTSMEGAAIN